MDQKNSRIQFNSITFNFPKILGSEKICSNFRREILLLSLQLKKKLKINFFQLRRAQSRAVEYRMHNAKIERDRTIPKGRSIDIYFYRCAILKNFLWQIPYATCILRTISTLLKVFKGKKLTHPNIHIPFFKFLSHIRNLYTSFCLGSNFKSDFISIPIPIPNPKMNETNFEISHVRKMWYV